MIVGLSAFASANLKLKRRSSASRISSWKLNETTSREEFGRALSFPLDGRDSCSPWACLHWVGSVGLVGFDGVWSDCSLLERAVYLRFCSDLGEERHHRHLCTLSREEWLAARGDCEGRVRIVLHPVFFFSKWSGTLLVPQVSRFGGFYHDIVVLTCLASREINLWDVMLIVHERPALFLLFRERRRSPALRRKPSIFLHLECSVFQHSRFSQDRFFPTFFAFGVASLASSSVSPNRIHRHYMAKSI